MSSKISQKFIGYYRFDENLDAAVAAKTPSGIKRHHGWLAGMNDLQCVCRHFFFETPGTERSDSSAVGCN